MKELRTIKKLNLGKITIAQLNNDQQRKVYGGTIVDGCGTKSENPADPNCNPNGGNSTQCSA